MPLVTINGNELFTVHVQAAAGTPENERITFLGIHRLGSTHSFFSSIIPQLKDHGYDYVTYDTYGSGQSKYKGGEQSVQSMAADVEELIKVYKLDSPRTILVAHSMGGMVACEVASRVHLRGLVLLTPVHPSPTISGFFQARIDNVIKNGMEALAYTVPVLATSSETTGAQRAFIRALIMSQDPQGYASLCKVIMDANAPNYIAIHCPLLILSGDADKPPLNASQMILQSWGTAGSEKSHDSLAPVGHWIGVEAGSEVGDRVARFADNIQVSG